MSSNDVLVLAETRGGAPTDMTLELVGGARQLAAQTGGKAVVVALGPEGSQAAGALSATDRIIIIDDPNLAGYSPEPYVAVLAGLVGAVKPRALLLGSTSVGLDVGPLLGARLGLPVVSGCQAVEAQGDMLKVTAGFCAGKMLAEIEVAGEMAILMVLPGSFRPSADSGAAQVERQASPAPLEPGAVTFDEMILPDSTDVDITAQDMLVAVGRGIQQRDNLELAQELAQALGGAVCASRPIVDQGWLPITRQVGKSGMTVKPKLYLALGVSGAPEHQEGMKGAGLIIAINTDPKAPIFDIAHYGAQVDLLDLVPPLVEAIKEKRG